MHDDVRFTNIDRTRGAVRPSCPRRHRRRTPMDPPPRDPSTGAKGSALLRLAGHVFFVLRSRGRGPRRRRARRTLMTAHRDMKNIIRERQAKTGESYTAARAHVMRERAGLLGLDPEGSPAGPAAVPAASAEAVILKVNQQSARVR